MKVEDMKKTAVVGAGTMGPGIAQRFAQAGYQANLIDIDEEALKRAEERVRKNLELFSEKESLDGDIETIMARIGVTKSLEDGLREADFVTEAVPEDLETKREVFEKLEKFCSKNTILASNCSGSMTIDDISSSLENQERCIITHWVNPPHIMRLVEIVPGSETSEKVIETTEGLLKKLGKKPVIFNKFEPGLVTNTLQSALMMAAYEIVEKGVVSMEDVDTVVKEGFGSRLATVGPFEFADVAGLDNLLQNMKSMYEQTGDEEYKPPEILKEKVKSGEVGLKSGKGIYNYEDKDMETLERKIYSSIIDQFKALDRMGNDEKK